MRLTYDHKGSDSHEAKRIQDAGGFVMNNRVNGKYSDVTFGSAVHRDHCSRTEPETYITGVLAVTRSLGDASMKEFVVGSPYTTETALDDQDEFLIVACDGVSHCRVCSGNRR